MVHKISDDHLRLRASLGRPERYVTPHGDTINHPAGLVRPMALATVAVLSSTEPRAGLTLLPFPPSRHAGGGKQLAAHHAATAPMSSEVTVPTASDHGTLTSTTAHAFPLIDAGVFERSVDEKRECSTHDAPPRAGENQGG
ncbi:hypothetical protein TM48_02811 [Mycobacterium shottsii]|uniref:Uncharacterized protein n=2 Tax=Mycobacterium shottsii TaxID=133549 RepID=A0A7I7LEJ3_9MYCO|nr:hypothetical protein TM48_02811 [Mycobacterium shottsii]BBX58456.1 hypothetical protein MSHO_38010 [Mycobacterium shottsii]